MKVAVPREIRDGEKRVALVPDIINKLTRLGFEVTIESGAGIHAQATDDAYRAAGATVQNGDVIASADVVLCHLLNTGTDEELKKRRSYYLIPFNCDVN